MMSATEEKRGRPAMRPDRWREEAEASGLLAEQIAHVVGKPIATVWSYNSGAGAVPSLSAINALARRNLAFAESKVIRLGLFDDC